MQEAEIISIVGTIASILGAVLTIVFSSKAKTAADAARVASNATMENIGRFNGLAELNSLLLTLDDLEGRLENSSWEMVSDRAQKARLCVAPLIANEHLVFSPDIDEGLNQIATQMRLLASAANRTRTNTESKPPSLSRLLGIVSDQKEVAVLAIAELQRSLKQDV